jgi:hypothetical protein
MLVENFQLFNRFNTSCGFSDQGAIFAITDD